MNKKYFMWHHIHRCILIDILKEPVPPTPRLLAKPITTRRHVRDISS